MSLQQQIKLKLKGFDHRILDQAVADIVNTVKKTGAKIRGPIPLPIKMERITLNRSSHIDKKSREQFQIKNSYRLLIIDPSAQTVDALMKLDLASGVDVEIKILGGSSQ